MPDWYYCRTHDAAELAPGPSCTARVGPCLSQEEATRIGSAVRVAGHERDRRMKGHAFTFAEISWEELAAGFEDPDTPTCPSCSKRGEPDKDGRVLLGEHWELSIEEGQPSVSCQACGRPFDVEDPIEFNGPFGLAVELHFVPEHPNLGGWHGLDTRCDCGWWFELVMIEKG